MFVNQLLPAIFPTFFILTSIWSKRFGISFLVLFVRIKTELYDALGQHQFYLRCSPKKSDFIAPKFHGLFCVNFKSNRLQHFRFTREQKKMISKSGMDQLHEKNKLNSYSRWRYIDIDGFWLWMIDDTVGMFMLYENIWAIKYWSHIQSNKPSFEL